MATPVSPHSAAEHIEEHQIQLDATANEAFDILDKSVHALFTKTLTSANYTLSATETEQSGYLRISGAFTANRTLTLPNNADSGTAPRPKHFIIEHAGTGGFTLTLKTVGGSGLTLAQGTVQAVYCDGTNVVSVAAATGSGGQPWDIHPYLPGLPGDGAIFYRTKIIRALRIPAGFTLSLGSSEVTATASATFSFKKNGVQCGTANFALSASVATFTAASNTDFAAGDELRIDSPSPQDATLSGVQFSIAATKL